MRQRITGWSCSLLVAALASSSLALAARPVVTTPIALGLNTASWDGEYTGGGAQTIDRSMAAAQVGLLRYPGGSWADEYNWRKNTDIYGCLVHSSSNKCPETDSLNFQTFTEQIHSIGAQSFVTVNYGSGSPRLAASWVAASQQPGRQVTFWEVGQESYGCWEANDHLAQAPTFIKGFKPNGKVCPGTKVMARSYAAHAGAYFRAMLRADPAAQIGLAWALRPSQAAGAGVKQAAVWNRVVLRRLGGLASFVDVHWYPFSPVKGLTDQEILASVRRIPRVMLGITKTLRRYDPVAHVVVGETNVSNQETPLDFRPITALYAAATALEWLSQGALSVDWWDMNNYGSPANGDYGMFSSGNPAPAGRPLPAYYGYRLASLLAAPGSHLIALHRLGGHLLAFASLQGTRRRELIVNGASHAVTVDLPFATPVQLTWYGAATARSRDPLRTASLPLSALSAFKVPARSVVVLSAP